MSEIIQSFVSPTTPRAPQPFYSSIAIDWQDLADACTTCLPCARETTTAPEKPLLVIDGKDII